MQEERSLRGDGAPRVEQHERGPARDGEGPLNNPTKGERPAQPPPSPALLPGGGGVGGGGSLREAGGVRLWQGLLLPPPILENPFQGTSGGGRDHLSWPDSVALGGSRKKGQGTPARSSAPSHPGSPHTVAPAAPGLPPSPSGLPSPSLAVTSPRKASRPPAPSLDHHPLEEYFGAPLSLGWEHGGAELL